MIKEIMKDLEKEFVSNKNMYEVSLRINNKKDMKFYDRKCDYLVNLYQEFIELVMDLEEAEVFGNKEQNDKIVEKLQDLHMAI